MCDILRYKNKLEKEVFNNAIQRYVKDQEKSNLHKGFSITSHLIFY